MSEAIILCGGTGWRLKPYTWIPKPLLSIIESPKKKTLLDLQIEWLKRHGFERIILASNQHLEIDHEVIEVVEKEKLGTGGAVKNALNKAKEDFIYVMNVDDIVTYDPRNLLEYADAGAAILLARPQIGFGVVELNGDFVVGFKEKPLLNFYVSAGHYVFRREVVEKYFPKVGDLEREVLPFIARDSILKGMKLEGEWYTINTYKDYINVKNLVESGRLSMWG